MGDRLATIDIGRKEEGCCAPWGGARSQSNTNVAWAEVYLRTKWHLGLSSRLATIDMGRKVGVLCPF